MQAVRIHRFGPPEFVVVEDIQAPSPGPHEALVSVAAAGVAPWDALIREGRSKVSPPPPLTLGSDLAGIVEALGPGVSEFKVGDEVYGVTNPQFCGAQAEYAVASAGMITLKPPSLNYLEAASAPVVAVTAWQMLFEYAQAGAGDNGHDRRSRRKRRSPCGTDRRERWNARGRDSASGRQGDASHTRCSERHRFDCARLRETPATGRLHSRYRGRRHTRPVRQRIEVRRQACLECLRTTSAST